MTCENGNEHHDGTGDDFGCRVKSFTINPYSLPSRLNFKNPPKQPEPRWERGIAKDQRGVPFLDKTGAPIGLKRYAEERHSIEQHRRQLANSTEKD